MIEASSSTQTKAQVTLRCSTSHISITALTGQVMFVSYIDKTTPCWVFKNIPQISSILASSGQFCAQTKLKVIQPHITPILEFPARNFHNICISYTGKTTPCWVLIYIPPALQILAIEVSSSAQRRAQVILHCSTSHLAIIAPTGLVMCVLYI